jgi:2-oxoglutarate dehydrogenase E2 component (dihydrolipoamide succinyltransferase)
MNLGDRPEQRVPMSRLRARVAERLLQSQATNAILTTFNEVNMAPVMEMRKKFQDKFEKEHGVKLGFMSFFVKAAVARAEEVPGAQRQRRRQRHRLPRLLRHRHRGGLAARPGGADPAQCRPDELCRHREEDRRVRQEGGDGKLGIEELTGGTFSISNGGTFGSMLSTPIINPPQSAILGVHATKDRAVVENGRSWCARSTTWR